MGRSTRCRGWQEVIKGMIFGTSGVAVGRYGLILSEDGATGSRKVFRYLWGLRDTIKKSKKTSKVKHEQILKITIYIYIYIWFEGVCFNSRHPGPRRAWKGGSEPQFMGPIRRIRGIRGRVPKWCFVEAVLKNSPGRRPSTLFLRRGTFSVKTQCPCKAM